MTENVKEVIAKMRRPTALAVAFDYYGLEKLRGVERRMREWAAEGRAAARDGRARTLFDQIASLFVDERPDLLAERLERASRLLDEIERPSGPPTVRKKRPDADTNVQYLKGVGPARARAFANLGVTTARDLLYLFPRDYVDRSSVTPLSDVRVGDDVTVEGTVGEIVLERKRRGKTLVTALLSDESGDILLKWFNAPYVADKVAAGDRVVASGKVKFYEAPQLINPEFEVLAEADAGESFRGITPIYPLSAGLNQRAVRRAAREALDALAAKLPEPLPAAVLARTGFPPLAEALRQVHYPDDMEEQRRARRRLSFEYLYLMEVGLLIKKRRELARAGVRIRGDGSLRARLELPFELTGAQKKALAAIDEDLAAPWPMRRLLQGDVGSGKTVVALEAMLAAAEAGFQAALMAPTEILARQHWRTAAALLEPADIACELLAATTPAGDRERILAGLADGGLRLVVGTHALLEPDVEFKNLGLAVVDEQHRFGVDQRQRLAAKGPSPNVLVMTATPIPRTLALCVYGDLELTIIDEMPAGRPGTTTTVLAEGRRDEAFELLGREVAAGRQGFVVYPVIEESEANALKAATAMAEKLAGETFPDYRIGLVHGRLPADEREATMAAFRHGDVDVLVATTVVEVGLDVPNATAMVVEHADRYGLSQLHQLRGRVGRGEHRAYFVAVAPTKTTAEAKARLKTLARTSDGFEIAEADLGIRGPGELLGTRQHGLPDFALQALVRDRDLLELARELAAATLAEDERLARAEHAALRQRIRADFGRRLQLAGAV
ncbi:MAG: ATP-dependent DNA helicase RecG [candidate division Zixibacteria bacterium]|nr:ATP-dependent DNA helicase RecG [candidate division Zixibacteria bacterium]